MKSHICLVIKIDKFGIESIEITINEGGVLITFSARVILLHFPILPPNGGGRIEKFCQVLYYLRFYSIPINLKSNKCWKLFLSVELSYEWSILGEAFYANVKYTKEKDRKNILSVSDGGLRAISINFVELQAALSWTSFCYESPHTCLFLHFVQNLD